MPEVNWISSEVARPHLRGDRLSSTSSVQVFAEREEGIEAIAARGTSLPRTTTPMQQRQRVAGKRVIERRLGRAQE